MEETECDRMPWSFRFRKFIGWRVFHKPPREWLAYVGGPADELIETLSNDGWIER